MRKETVALHSMAGELRRHVSPAQERDLIAQGKAHWVCSRCGRYSGKGRCLGAAQHAMIFRLTHLERAEHESSASITAKETLANVGITSEKAGEVANGNTVRAAQNKIEAWPVTIDTKAPIFNSALAHLLRSRALAPTLAVLLLAFLAPLARGQNTASIQGKLVDGGGNAVTNSKVTFELQYCNGDATVAGGVIVQPLTLRYGSGIDSTGTLSGSIYKNSVISCFGTVAATRWRVCKYVAGSSVRCDEYNITGATFDISTAVPIAIPSNAPLPSINLRDSNIVGLLPVANGGANNNVYTQNAAIGYDGAKLASLASLSVPFGGTGTTSFNTNGLAYYDGSKLTSSATGGAGTLCAVSTNGGPWVPSSCAGSASTSWSALSAATGNLAINNGAFSTTISGSGFFQVGGVVFPGQVSVGGLPSAFLNPGGLIRVSDSTAIAAEGQTCVGGSSNNALALSNGTVWKCF